MRWRQTLQPALLLAALAGGGAFLFIPTATHSGFDAMGYWVDWAVLGALAAGSAALTLGFAWPLLTLLRGGAAHNFPR